MKRTWAILAQLASVLAFPAHAAEAAASDFSSTVASTTTQFEEVVVSGKLDSLSELKQAVDRAEDRVYERYNELNKDPAYDIDCVTEAPTGTRLKAKKCQPNYVSDAVHDDTVDVFYRNQGQATRMQSVNALAASKLSYLRKAMLEAARKDAAMQRAMVEHALLKDRYEKLLKERLAAQPAVWD